MSYKIFIDGEAGTTGLQVRDRLLQHPETELIQLGEADRKNPAMRHDAMAAAIALSRYGQTLIRWHRSLRS